MNTIHKIESLLAKKEAFLASTPNKYVAAEVATLKEHIAELESFIEQNYNPMAQFLTTLRAFLKQNSITQKELEEVIHNPESSNKDKKAAILNSLARTYSAEYEDIEFRYANLYYFLINMRLDLAYQQIDEEDAALDRANRKLLERVGQPLHKDKDHYKNFWAQKAKGL
jgi:hypothetical protein